MADIDEEVIPAGNQAAQEDVDLSDETQDFRFLAALSLDGSKIPKRGEKDFEPHATALQSSTLAASRQAMHNALSIERSHHPKGYVYATYHPETNMAYAINPRGVWISKMGQVLPPGKDPLGNDELRGHRLWLLPEEALYLLERGTIDIRWPGTEHEAGPPMSLQAAYAMFLGDEASHDGVLTFERYSVYSALRRGGYTVLRAPSWDRPPAINSAYCCPSIVPQSRLGLYSMLERIGLLFASSPQPHIPHSDLVGQGYHRSYTIIYQRLALINAFDPTQEKLGEIQMIDDHPPCRVAFHIFKPSNTIFKKTAPGEPDFRLAVIDARKTSVPTLQQLSTLMASQPYEPPPATPHVYAKLRHGYKNVVLAVVDQGVTSYLRFADAAFTTKKLYERAGKGPANKRGGRQNNRSKGRQA